jgi:hypothetical protein
MVRPRRRSSDPVVGRPIPSSVVRNRTPAKVTCFPNGRPRSASGFGPQREIEVSYGGVEARPKSNAGESHSLSERSSEIGIRIRTTTRNRSEFPRAFDFGRFGARVHSCQRGRVGPAGRRGHWPVTWALVGHVAPKLSPRRSPSRAPRRPADLQSRRRSGAAGRRPATEAASRSRNCPCPDAGC